MESYKKNVCINVFNGEEDAKEFLKSFKLHSLVLNWDESKQCQAIKHLLSDKAEHIYEAMTKENQNDIDEIFKALDDGCIKSQEILLDRFFTRKPQPNETLAHLAVSLQSLLNKAMPQLNEKDRDALLRRQVGAFLPQHLRTLISFSVNKTWRDFINDLDQTFPNVMAVDDQETRFNEDYLKKPINHNELVCFARKKITENEIDDLKAFDDNSQNKRIQKQSKLDGENKTVSNINSSVLLLDLEPTGISFKNDDSVKNEKHTQQSMNALIDSRSRDSFISFSILNSDTQNAVRELEKKYQRDTVSTKEKETEAGTTAAESSEDCVTGKLKIEIGDWCGEHLFIISEKMSDKKIILGKDFLKLISKK